MSFWHRIIGRKPPPPQKPKLPQAPNPLLAEDLKNGDIVVFGSPRDGDTSLIERGMGKAQSIGAATGEEKSYFGHGADVHSAIVRRDEGSSNIFLMHISGNLRETVFDPKNHWNVPIYVFRSKEEGLGLQISNAASAKIRENSWSFNKPGVPLLLYNVRYNKDSKDKVDSETGIYEFEMNQMFICSQFVVGCVKEGADIYRDSKKEIESFRIPNIKETGTSEVVKLEPIFLNNKTAAADGHEFIPLQVKTTLTKTMVSYLRSHPEQFENLYIEVKPGKDHKYSKEKFVDKLLNEKYIPKHMNTNFGLTYLLYYYIKSNMKDAGDKEFINIIAQAKKIEANYTADGTSPCLDKLILDLKHSLGMYPEWFDAEKTSSSESITNETLFLKFNNMSKLSIENYKFACQKSLDEWKMEYPSNNSLKIFEAKLENLNSDNVQTFLDVTKEIENIKNSSEFGLSRPNKRILSLLQKNFGNDPPVTLFAPTKLLGPRYI